jgi:serine/threonine protein kinase
VTFKEARICEPNWEAFSGTVLPGGYEAGEILQAHPQNVTFRARVLGDWSAKALLHVYSAAGREADEQVALWSSAKELQHENVTSPWTAGKFEPDGAALIYAVVPGADETLAGLLRDRPVTVEEAHEILINLRRGLIYLHSHGWVHGHLSPEQVLAVGDSIRISSQFAHKINTPRPLELVEAKYVAPEAASGNMTPAADVWCLGATLFEALTQKIYSADLFAEISGLPAPFDKTLAKCLDPNPQTRTRIERIGAAEVTQPTTAVNGPPQPTQANAVPTPAKEHSTPTVTLVAQRSNLEQPASTRQKKFWIYGAVLVVAVLALFWAARPRTTPQTPSAPPQQAPIPATTSAQPDSTPALVRNKETAATDPAVWRVVVFTYNRDADAQKKAESVNKRHPDLDATVFRPKDGSPYLVTVGGNMTKDQAARLRQRVLRLGLPRDSYIQNYKQ